MDTLKLRLNFRWRHMLNETYKNGNMTVLMEFGIIYLVTNKLNNKIYVGKTTQTFRKRKLQHLSVARRKNDKSYFHNAIRKYGEKNFKWCILCKCYSEMELNLIEKLYIDIYDTYNSGYNLTLGGEGISGWKHSDITKKKLSKKSKECWLNEDYINKVNTEERNKKIAETMSRIQLENWNDNEWRQKRIKNIRKANTSIEHRKNCKERMDKLYESSIERQKQGERVSKEWIIINPSGVYLKIKNLKKFCRKNNLNITGMWRTYKGIQNEYKGWKCIRKGGDSN